MPSYGPRRYDTREYAEAQTRHEDERDREYWKRLLIKDNWTVHYEDYHGIGRVMSYAMATIDVHHAAGEGGFFYADHQHPFVESSIIPFSVIVFADELVSSRTVPPVPYNRQSSDNTYVYHLYLNDSPFFHDEASLKKVPTGNLRLEIMIPLFKMEKIVSFFVHSEHSYSVSTSQQTYNSYELEQNDGFMGLSRPSREAPNGYVWKLDKKPTNIDNFRSEMHRRALAWCPDYEDNYAGFAQDNRRPANIRVKVPAATIEHEYVNPARVKINRNEQETEVKVECEDGARIQYYSRHCDGALDVHRNGTRMRF